MLLSFENVCFDLFNIQTRCGCGPKKAQNGKKSVERHHDSGSQMNQEINDRTNRSDAQIAYDIFFSFLLRLLIVWSARRQTLQKLQASLIASVWLAVYFFLFSSQMFAHFATDNVLLLMWLDVDTHCRSKLLQRMLGAELVRLPWIFHAINKRFHLLIAAAYWPF